MSLIVHSPRFLSYFLTTMRRGTKRRKSVERRSALVRAEYLEDRCLLSGVNDPFADRIADHLATSTARNGVEVLNLTTGDSDSVNGNGVFGTSSTIKSGVLYTLLRKIDSDASLTLNTVINVGPNYGTTSGRGNIPANSNQSLRTLARHMIDTSDNFAANRLMDFVENRYNFVTDTWGAPGTFPVANAEFAALGLPNTRLDRYNTGTNSPSAHRLAGPEADYRAGHDNESTPNEMVSLLRQNENAGLLSAASHTFFWDTLGLNDTGQLTRLYDDAVFVSNAPSSWQTIIDLDSKAGSNNWLGNVGDFTDDPTIGAHFQRSEAGRVELANGEVLFYAMFADEANNRFSASGSQFCVGYEVASEYADAFVTHTPTSCQLDDGRVLTINGDSADVDLVLSGSSLSIFIDGNSITTVRGSEIDLVRFLGSANHVSIIGDPSGNTINVSGDFSGGTTEVVLGGVTIPIGSQPFSLDGGGGGDVFRIDFSFGNPVATSGLDIDGNGGTDSLIVQGGGDVTYTPDASGLADRGMLAVGGSTLIFSSLEFVTPVVPDITSTTLSSASIDENGVATLSGSFIDAGSLSTHTIVINWDDAASPGDIETLHLSATATATKNFTVTHTYVDDHPLSGTPFDILPISVTVTDNDGLFDSQDTQVTLNNVNPTINSINLSAASINEGQSVTLSGTFNDPALGIATETFTGTARWSDGAVTAVTVDGTNGTFSSTRAFPDDHPITGTPADDYTVDITITDDDTGADTTTSSILTVNNVDPVILDFASDASFADKAEEGEAVHIVANFTDAGILDTHVAEIDWGDGTVELATVTPGLPGTGTVTSAHAYAAGGIFTITVTLTDDDTGTATAETIAVVTGVGLNDRTLYIIGTSDDDRVKMNRKGHDELKVKASFIPEHFRLFDVTAVDKIVSYLGEGEDHLNISTWVTTPAIIHGGADADHLHAGGGPTVLLGDDGDDKLFGGRGRNILIGGSGSDKLTGRKDSDVLIGGSTTSDNDDDALMAIAMAWATDDYNENLVLAVDALLTVIDDGEVDRLIGGLGVDLFYDGLGDKLIGVKRIEVVF